MMSALSCSLNCPKNCSTKVVTFFTVGVPRKTVAVRADGLSSSLTLGASGTSILMVAVLSRRSYDRPSN